MLLNKENNLPVLFSSDPAAIAAAETVKARIQAAYMIALHKPRDEDQARAEILKACRRPEFAEQVQYSKPIGDTKIKGLSIRFTEMALTAWRNTDIDIQTVYEDEKIRRIKVRVLDLETNTGFSEELQINKTVERKKIQGREVIGQRVNTYGEKVYIVIATEDELKNKEAAMISKAIRNQGLRLLPSDIKSEAEKTAIKTIRDKLAKDPEGEKKKIIDAFAIDLRLMPKELEKYLGHSLDIISPSEIEDLRGIYRAIKDGETSWVEIIGMDVSNGNSDEKDKPSTLAEMAAKKAKEKNTNQTTTKETKEKPTEIKLNKLQQQVADAPLALVLEACDLLIKNKKLEPYIKEAIENGAFVGLKGKECELICNEASNLIDRKAT